MQIWLNDELLQIAESINLADFVAQFAPSKNTFATALNDTFVSRDQYASTVLQDGDRIEIVVAMQGG